MPSLRSIANEFHRAANRIAARADRTGTLTGKQKAAIDLYREAAAKVEALIRPEDALRKSDPTVWSEPAKPQQAKKSKMGQKLATPQEILEKAQ